MENLQQDQATATQRAKELALKIMEAQEYKALLDKEIREAKNELTVLAENNPQWFTSEGKPVKYCLFGEAKLVWKTASPTYSFSHSNQALIVKFLEDYPKSIGFEFKKMDNVPLEDYGITAKKNDPKLNIEKVKID